VVQDSDQRDGVEAPLRVAPGEAGLHDGDRGVVGEALRCGTGHPGVGFEPGDRDSPAAKKRDEVPGSAPDIEDVASPGPADPVGDPGAVVVVVTPRVPLIDTVEVST
jgi:hypothetical protein